MEQLSASLQTMLAVQGFLVSKLAPQDRDELDAVLKLMVSDMSKATENWTAKGDPQKYRDAMSFEIQRLLSLPRSTPAPSGENADRKGTQ